MNYLESGTGGVQKYYRDCAYIEIRERNDEFFLPTPAVRHSTTSLSTKPTPPTLALETGCTRRAITRSNPERLPGRWFDQSALGGTSVSTNNQRVGRHRHRFDRLRGQWVQLRFVMEHNNVGGNGNTPTNYTMPAGTSTTFAWATPPANGWMKSAASSFCERRRPTTQRLRAANRAETARRGPPGRLQHQPGCWSTTRRQPDVGLDRGHHRAMEHRRQRPQITGLHVQFRLGPGSTFRPCCTGSTLERVSEPDSTKPIWPIRKSTEAHGTRWPALRLPADLGGHRFSPSIERQLRSSHRGHQARQPRVFGSPRHPVVHHRADLPEDIVVDQWNQLSSPMFGFEALISFNFDPANNFFDCRVSEIWLTSVWTPRQRRSRTGQRR